MDWRVGAPMESWDHSGSRLPPSQFLRASGVREVKIDPPRAPTTVENWSQATSRFLGGSWGHVPGMLGELCRHPNKKNKQNHLKKWIETDLEFLVEIWTNSRIATSTQDYHHDNSLPPVFCPQGGRSSDLGQVEGAAVREAQHRFWLFLAMEARFLTWTQTVLPRQSLEDSVGELTKKTMYGAELLNQKWINSVSKHQFAASPGESWRNHLPQRENIRKIIRKIIRDGHSKSKRKTTPSPTLLLLVFVEAEATSKAGRYTIPSILAKGCRDDLLYPPST